MGKNARVTWRRAESLHCSTFEIRESSTGGTSALDSYILTAVNLVDGMMCSTTVVPAIFCERRRLLSQ